MTIDEVKEETNRRYIAEDGLMRLKPFPEDDRSPFPGVTKRTVWNQNGILWRAYYMAELFRLGRVSASKFQEVQLVIDSLAVRGGLYGRWPNGDLVSSVDNDLAILFLASPRQLGDIAQYGENNFWCFNCLKPDAVSLRYIRPPNFSFLVKLLTSRRVSLVEKLWWRGSIEVLKRQDPLYRTSEYLLANLMRAALRRHAPTETDAIKDLSSVLDKVSIPEIYAAQLGTDHPVYRIAKRQPGDV
jgi:hypothetical protein